MDELLGTRESLNGGWELAWDETRDPPERPPEKLDWREAPTFPLAWDAAAAPEEWRSAPGGWLRRGLTLEARAGRRTWLRFDALWPGAVFFLNGKRFYTGREGYLPLELDLTDHLQPGTNELALWCGKAGGGANVPPRGPWQDIWLLDTPAVSLSDVAVRTSLRYGELEAEVTLENRTLADFQGRLELAVLAGEEEVLHLAPLEVELARGRMNSFRLRARWTGARLWSPEDPYLYTLCSRILQDGVRLDERRLRFGFREIALTPDGAALRLNGAALHGRAESWKYPPLEVLSGADLLERFRQARRRGVELVRLAGMPFPERFLAAADEAGMLLAVESARLDADAGQAGLDHLRGLARRDRSHPAVALWGIGETGISAAEAHASLRALDPTRPALPSAAMPFFPSPAAAP